MNHIFYRTCAASLIACVVLMMSACQSTPPHASPALSLGDTHDYVGSSD